MGQLDILNEVMAFLKENPLEVNLKTGDKELVVLKVTEKKIDVDLRDPSQLAAIAKMFK